MEPDWGSIRQLAILRSGYIGREEIGENSAQYEHHKERQSPPQAPIGRRRNTKQTKIHETNECSKLFRLFREFSFVSYFVFCLHPTLNFVWPPDARISGGKQQIPQKIAKREQQGGVDQTGHEHIQITAQQ